MPLDRDNINPASRVTLWLYAIVNIGFGTALLREPVSELLGAPAFRTLDDLFDIRAWGLLFLGVGIAQAASRAFKRRESYILALGLMMLLGGVFTVTVIVGAAQDVNPWTSPWFPLCYTGVALATLVQLESRTR